MKILQVTPYFPPAYAFGGPVKVAYQISRELVKRGHEVVVYTSDARDLDSRLDIEPIKFSDGVRVYYFRNLSLIFVKKLKLFITPQLAIHAKEEVRDFDVIHLHEYRTFQNIVAAYYAKKHNVPYVLQAHGSLPRIDAWRRLKLLYDTLFGYRLLRNAAKVIALTRAEAEQYKQMGVPEEKIAIIPIGIDLSEYADLPPKGCFREKYGIPREEKMILYLGRIIRTKGLDILAKAFANIARKLDNVGLVVVDPDYGYLNGFKALTKALRIEDKVLITGPIFEKDRIREAYVDADVYVLPSRYDTFPMTVLEAIACGTPVILTESCGAAEYFKDKVGLVVKTSALSLSEAILKILQDKAMHERFSNNCKLVAKDFDISKIVSKLEKVYEESAYN